MTQTHTTQTEEQFLARLSLAFMPILSGLVVLGGALASVGLAVTGMQLVAFLFCVIPAGASCALALLERRQTRQKQRALLAAFTSTCRAVLDGQSAVRVPAELTGYDPGVEQLGKALNVLLDGYTYMEKEGQARRQELAHLYDEIEQLLYEIKPVMEGDLHARSTVAGGPLANIAAICNALIEDTAQFVQWTQYTSDQIIQTSHSLMSLSLGIAQSIETFARQHKATTGAIETVLAFMLRMESALFSSIKSFEENWERQQQKLPEGAEQPPISRPLGINARVMAELFDIPQQMEQLENLLRRTHETTSLAEDTIKKLREIEQRFHHINESVMQFANVIGALAALADDWRQAAENYVIIEQKENIHV